MENAFAVSRNSCQDTAVDIVVMTLAVHDIGNAESSSAGVAVIENDAIVGLDVDCRVETVQIFLQRQYIGEVQALDRESCHPVPKERIRVKRLHHLNQVVEVIDE